VADLRPLVEQVADWLTDEGAGESTGELRELGEDLG
jgi:hypothetical protein